MVSKFFIMRIFLLCLTFIMVFGCDDPISKKGIPDSLTDHQSGQYQDEYRDENNEDPDPVTFEANDIIINEIMIRQTQTRPDPDFGVYSGWIELHNRELHPVDLSGWILSVSDLSSHTSVEYSIHDVRSYVFPDDFRIAADEYVLLWASGVDHVREAVHLPFILPEGGAKIGLYGPDMAGLPIIDTLTYNSYDVAYDISLGRMNFGRDHKGFLLPMSMPTPGKKNQLEKLDLLESFSPEVKGPSGLDTDHSKNYLWTVSDADGGGIYKMDRQGRIVSRLPVQGNDMEGISQHPHNRTLFVVEERMRKIVQYDTLGMEIARFEVPVEQINENDGPEGIAINPFNNHIFVVNEKNPRVLIELDVLKGVDRQVIRKTPVNFGAAGDAAGLDLSGLFFDAEDRILWMVSDEARAVFILDTRGRPLAAFDAGQKDLEGIALIRSENKLFLVSDDLETLFVYSIPQPLLMLAPKEQDFVAIGCSFCLYASRIVSLNLYK